MSFPKSGNTWIRFLIGNLINPEVPVGFTNIERVVPDIAGSPRKLFRKVMRPRVIKSHDCFDPRYRRVIYILRDPRDVAVSSYFYAKKMKNIEDSVSIADYITNDFMLGGDYNGTWGEHVGSWIINTEIVSAFMTPGGFRRTHNGFRSRPSLDQLGARGHGREFLLVRYEDLLEDTQANLQRISQFMGIHANADRIRLAVERSSARNMRDLESAQSRKWVTTRESRKDINFVRQATSGQWRKTLAPESVAAIESAWGFLMELSGYKLASKRLEHS